MSLLNLRGRFIAGAMIGLSLFAVILAAGVFIAFLPMFDALEEVVNETFEEFQPVIDLRTKSLLANRAVYNYYNGGNPAERETFRSLSGSIESSFAALANAPISQADERAMIDFARNRWTLALSFAEPIMAGDNSLDAAAAAQALASFNAHMQRVTATLLRASEISRKEIRHELDEARESKVDGLMLFGGAFVLGIIVVTGVGLALIFSVLVPIERLTKGATRFAEGDFSHRVTWPGKDEFGTLANAFNAMAEQLEEDRSRLEAMSFQDALTGVYNRRAFQDRLEEEIARSGRYGRPCSLLMLDIDHFKAINDTYGHQAGDEVLYSIATELQVQARTTDCVARYGGEEFAVILPETSPQKALVLAERMRERIAAEEFVLANQISINVAMSIGVAAYPDDAETFDELVSASDKALYAAKRGGRNQVRRYGRETPLPGSDGKPAPTGDQKNDAPE